MMAGINQRGSHLLESLWWYYIITSLPRALVLTPKLFVQTKRNCRERSQLNSSVRICIVSIFCQHVGAQKHVFQGIIESFGGPCWVSGNIYELVRPREARILLLLPGAAVWSRPIQNQAAAHTALPAPIAWRKMEFSVSLKSFTLPVCTPCAMKHQLWAPLSCRSCGRGSLKSLRFCEEDSALLQAHAVKVPCTWPLREREEQRHTDVI